MLPRRDSYSPQNHSTWEMERRGPEAQGQSQVYHKFDTSLGPMKLGEETER